MSFFLNKLSWLVRILLYFKMFKTVKKLDYSNMTLSFQDDFKGRALDTSKWMTHYYWGNSHTPGEQQFYATDAFTLKNSILTINVENRKVKGWYMSNGKRNSKVFEVTSGLIHTGESFKQRYGRFEIRCKVPMAKGFLPSFWLINPTCYPPEIDIFDFNRDKNTQLQVGYTYGDENVESQLHQVRKTVELLSIKEYNIYTLDWTPTELTWYFNGHVIFNAKYKGIPQSPMYMAINMAITEHDEDDLANKKMMIDWVKAYKYI